MALNAVAVAKSNQQKLCNYTPTPPPPPTTTNHWNGIVVHNRITPSSMLPVPIYSQARPRTTDLWICCQTS